LTQGLDLAVGWHPPSRRPSKPLYESLMANNRYQVSRTSKARDSR